MEQATQTPDVDFFICVTCKREVCSFPFTGREQFQCATCQWLDTYIKDPVEREELRARLEK